MSDLREMSRYNIETQTKKPAQGRSFLYMARPAGLARTSCARGYALPLALPKRS